MSITVVVRNNNLEQAMRVLKKKVQKAGIVKELRQRQYYEKPSDKRNGRRYQILKIKYGVADVFLGTVPCGSSSKKRT